MKTQYISLLRMAQLTPKPTDVKEVKRAHKEAKQVVMAAMQVQMMNVCNIGNTNFYDEVMRKVSNIVLSPAHIEGYCTYLNELLNRGV